MKTLLLSIMVLIGSMTILPKKADAGIILTMTTGPVGAAVIVGGGAVAYFSIKNGSDQNLGGISGVFLGGLLMVLDAEEAIAAKNSFQTIPAYIFDEIQVIAESLKADGILVEENLVEVLFSNEEVDELFSTLDETVDQSELVQLRTILTTSSIK